MYMRSMGLFAVLVAFVAVVVLHRPASLAQEKGSSETISSLTERIKELEARVERLEESRQILALPAPRAELPTPPKGPQEYQLRPDSLPEPALPKGWQRKEFNGVPYYIIPLDSGSNAASAESR